MVLWIVVSIGFSVYVALRQLRQDIRVIGSRRRVWFYLSSYAVCIGAEVNAELERQTHVDTTVGPPKLHGERGAYVADHPAEETETRERSPTRGARR
jgi:membrane protein